MLVLRLLALAPLLAACTFAEEPPHTQVGRVAINCRADVDRAFEKQNRGALSMQDMGGSPFSSTGISGITTTGLSSEYHRERMMDQCLKSSGVAPTTSPGGHDSLSPRESFSPGHTVHMTP